MKYLVQGCESKERLTIIIGLTRISSASIKQALFDHLQSNHLGLPEHLAAAKNNVQESNFNRALVRINATACEIEKVKQLDWQHCNIKQGIN